MIVLCIKTPPRPHRWTGTDLRSWCHDCEMRASWPGAVEPCRAKLRAGYDERTDGAELLRAVSSAMGRGEASDGLGVSLRVGGALSEGCRWVGRRGRGMGT